MADFNVIDPPAVFLDDTPEIGVQIEIPAGGTVMDDARVAAFVSSTVPAGYKMIVGLTASKRFVKVTP